MNVPIEIVVLFLSANLALQGWTLLEVVKLKTKVAVLSAKQNEKENEH